MKSDKTIDNIEREEVIEKKCFCCAGYLTETIVEMGWSVCENCYREIHARDWEIGRLKTKLTTCEAVVEAAREVMKCDTKIFIGYGAEKAIDGLAEALRTLLPTETRNENE